MKPREWWLFYDHDKDRGDDWFVDSLNLKKVDKNHVKKGIHVIEYSAYEALKKDRDNLVALLSGDPVEVVCKTPGWHATIHNFGEKNEL